MTTVSEAVKSILAHIVRQAAVLAGASMVALWIADEGARVLRVAAATDTSASNHLPLVSLTFGQGGVGSVAAERGSLQVDDMFTDSRFVGQDLTRALRMICRQLGALTGADTVAAYLLDRERQCVQPVAGYHVPKSLLEALAVSSVTVGELQFRDVLFNDGRAVWTDDAPGDARFANSLFTLFPHQSALVIPLTVDEETSGGFYLVWWERRRQFDYEEIEMLAAIGDQVGVLLRNARLREALEHRTTRLRELVHVNQVLSSSLDSREVLTEIARAAARLAGAPGVVFYVAEPVKRTLEARAFSNGDATQDFPIRVLPFGHGGAGWIAVNQACLERSRRLR